MGDYTITIRAEETGTETVISIDLDGSTPRVVELAMRAGSGLSAPTLPTFDLNQLLQVLFPSSAAVEQAAEQPQPASRAAVGKRSVQSAPRPGTAAPGRRRTEAPALTGRVYRRMPDDVVEVFNRTGTVTAVAEHYGVPRHTAQGWIGRLRRSGAFSGAS